MGYRGATVISWSGARAGVAPEAGMGVLASSLAYYDGLAKSGRISGYRVYGGTQSSAGMLVVEGELDVLVALAVETDSLKYLAQAHSVVADVRVEHFAGGSAEDATTYYLHGLQAVQEAGLSSS